MSAFTVVETDLACDATQNRRVSNGQSRDSKKSSEKRSTPPLAWIRRDTTMPRTSRASAPPTTATTRTRAPCVIHNTPHRSVVTESQSPGLARPERARRASHRASYRDVPIVAIARCHRRRIARASTARRTRTYLDFLRLESGDAADERGREKRGHRRSGVRGMTPEGARDLASSPGAIARVDPSKGGLARFVTSSKPMWRCDA